MGCEQKAHFSRFCRCLTQFDHQEDFTLQAEALGASPIERCSSRKTALKDCRLCSAKTALLSAREEEEYTALKDHTELDSITGRLHVRYLFCRDPSCLVDNGYAVKARKIGQEKKQLKEGINKQYIDQFLDMVSRGVVSRIEKE